MSFEYTRMVVACRCHLPIRLAPTMHKFLRSQVSRLSYQADYDPRNSSPLNGNSNSRDTDNRRSNMLDATEMVKEGITNVIDVAQAVGENAKAAVDTVWESTKEGTGNIKETIKDSGKGPTKDEVKAATESGIEEEWKRRLHNRP